LHAACYALEKLNITRKKDLCLFLKTRGEVGGVYRKAEKGFQNKRVYVGECGVTACLRREYAQALRGEIIEDAKRGPQFARVNVIGALCGGEHYAIERFR
jgi:hypothetical protein